MSSQNSGISYISTSKPLEILVNFKAAIEFVIVKLSQGFLVPGLIESAAVDYDRLKKKKKNVMLMASLNTPAGKMFTRKM